MHHATSGNVLPLFLPALCTRGAVNDADSGEETLALYRTPECGDRPAVGCNEHLASFVEETSRKPEK